MCVKRDLENNLYTLILCNFELRQLTKFKSADKMKYTDLKN